MSLEDKVEVLKAAIMHKRLDTAVKLLEQQHDISYADRLEALKLSMKNEGITQVEAILLNGLLEEASLEDKIELLNIAIWRNRFDTVFTLLSKSSQIPEHLNKISLDVLVLEAAIENREDVIRIITPMVIEAVKQRKLTLFSAREQIDVVIRFAASNSLDWLREVLQSLPKDYSYENEGFTKAIEQAVDNEQTDIVYYILENFKDQEIYYTNMSTACRKALKEGNIELVSYLITNFKDVLNINYNAVISAIDQGNFEIIQMIAPYIAARSAYPFSYVLSHAVDRGRADMALTLIEHCIEKIKVDGIFDDNHYVKILLKTIIKNNYVEVLDLLLKKILEEILPRLGWILERASNEGKEEILNVLLTEDLRVLYSKDEVKSSLEAALSNNNSKVIIILFDRLRALIEKNEVLQLLKKAVNNGHMEVVKLILEREGREISYKERYKLYKQAKENGHEKMAKVIRNDTLRCMVPAMLGCIGISAVIGVAHRAGLSQYTYTTAIEPVYQALVWYTAEVIEKVPEVVEIGIQNNKLVVGGMLCMYGVYRFGVHLKEMRSCRTGFEGIEHEVWESIKSAGNELKGMVLSIGTYALTETAVTMAIAPVNPIVAPMVGIIAGLGAAYITHKMIEGNDQSLQRN
jgi:glycerophosphoryl diester phosphodiesterase